MMSEAILPGDPPLGRGQPRSEDRRELTGAAFASGAVHAILIALLIGLWHPQPEENAPAPIPVTLRSEQIGASGASGEGHNVIAGSAASDAAASPAPQSAPSPPHAEATAPAQQTATAPTPVPAPPQPPAAAEIPPTATAALEPVPPRKPAPPRPHPEAMTAQTQPTPQRAQATPPQPPSPAPAPSQSAAAQPSNAAAQQDAGGRGRGDEGAGRAAVGNGALDGPGDDYLEAVRRWVTRFRTYPDEAIAKKEEGTVAVGFKFARDGTVLDAWIEHGSGYPLLDDAALKMVHAASPIPKVPEQYKGEVLTLVMPERFRIGVFDRLFH